MEKSYNVTSNSIKRRNLSLYIKRKAQKRHNKCTEFGKTTKYRYDLGQECLPVTSLFFTKLNILRLHELIWSSSCLVQVCRFKLMFLMCMAALGKNILVQSVFTLQRSLLSTTKRMINTSPFITEKNIVSATGQNKTATYTVPIKCHFTM